MANIAHLFDIRDPLPNVSRDLRGELLMAALHQHLRRDAKLKEELRRTVEALAKDPNKIEKP